VEGDRFRVDVLIERWFTFRRHVVGVDGRNHSLDQLRFRKELIRRRDLLEIDFAVHFRGAMAFRAFLSEQRHHLSVKIGTLNVCRNADEQQ
jgi:hypothetical protein